MCPTDVSLWPVLWAHHSAIYNTSKWPRCHSSNPVGFISRLLWTQFIQYHLCSCLDNTSSSPSLCLTTACCSWMFYAKTRRPCSWGSCCACQEAASATGTVSIQYPEAPDVPTKKLQVATSQVRPVPVFVPTSSRPCGPASCSYEPEWHLVPQFPLGIGCPCRTVLASLCGASPSSCELALASSLLPPSATLLNKTFVLLFITVLRSLSFLILH